MTKKSVKHPPEPGHPMQPLVEAKNTRDDGPRFKGNAIVEHLLDVASSHGTDMNALAVMQFSAEDREQFAQLISYSLGGFSELGYVRDETYATAARMWEAGETEEQARIAVLEAALAEVRDGLRPVAAVLFGVHPDDLQ